MFCFETVSPESLGIPSESILAFIEKGKKTFDRNAFAADPAAPKTLP